ncbi:MAG: class I SAM-dependent methyltransferase [Alphaproteobacteria bacterium]
MTGFSADWLALREPFDVAARDDALARAFLARVPDGGRIVDLGAGAGSNIGRLRALAAQSGRRLSWLHVDDDEALLATARRRFAGDDTIAFARLDLAAALEEALDGAAAVTCAALVDLVSGAWIGRFAAELAARRLPLLAVLTYDGRMDWTPADASDPVVARAFHRDMASDKGFGAALGPDSAFALDEALRAHGATTALRDSDWRIAAADDAMLGAMLGGIGEAAARAARGDEGRAIAAWATRRARQRAAGALSLVVGHQDLDASWG